MWYKIVLSNLNNNIELNINIPESLYNVLLEFKKRGKLALIVGGSVRDALMGISPKDIDIEVYNTTYDELVEILKSVPHKRIDLVGQSFAVVKFIDLNNNSFDFALPRREQKSGVGHKDFIIVPDPNISPKEAALRRDFTFNAMGYDPISKKIYDYYGGQKDLQNRIIRHVSSLFKDDPLRILRAMQFAARFDFDLAEETKLLARQMLKDFTSLNIEQLIQIYPEMFKNLTMEELKEKYPGLVNEIMYIAIPEQLKILYPDKSLNEIKSEIINLTKERIMEEFLKLVLKGKKPSKGLEILRETEWIKLFPHLYSLLNVPQDPIHHPEGDVWTHTLHTIDAAANIAKRENLSDEEKIVLVLSALCHDIAKPLTTQLSDKKDKMTGEIVKRWTSPSHHLEGERIAKEFLTHLGINKNIISKVTTLIKNHMVDALLNLTRENIIKLSQELQKAGVNINLLTLLMEADKSGRPPKPPQKGEKTQELYDKANEYGVLYEAPKPILTGKDIIQTANELGISIKPGEEFKKIIDEAQNQYIKGIITDKNEILKWLKQLLLKRYVKPLLTGDELKKLGIPVQLIGKVIEELRQKQLNKQITTKLDAINWVKENYSHENE